MVAENGRIQTQPMTLYDFEPRRKQHFNEAELRYT